MRAGVLFTAAAPPRQLPLPPPPFLPLPEPPPVSFQSRISPSVLLIILILSVIFFVSGLLHLLVRFLFRPAPRDPRDAGGGGANATAFHGQLQQLFHLHDAGVDQSFIDALPVFLYGAVVGGKDPFDCAVCLCEFAADDRLRLLPKCSHAFHVDCIDTWLLSHSTCPLCRRSLLADFPSPCGGGGCSSPLLFVLESAGSESSAVSDRVDGASSAAHLSLVVMEEEEEEAWEGQKHGGDVVVPVKLGKFRSQAAGEQDVRRCYSMGTYEYVMDQSALLRVSVKPPAKKRPAAATRMHRVAMSECGDAPPKAEESFSISKIWTRGGGRKEGPPSSGSSSFRLPQRAASDIGGAPKLRADVVSPVTESEYNVSAWDKTSLVDWDPVDVTTTDAGDGNMLSSRSDEAPSFARRTLLWIRGHL